MWWVQTPAGKSLLGVYDHPAPPDTAISSQELDPDAWPIPTSGMTFRAIFKTAEWFTSAHDHFLELVGG